MRNQYVIAYDICDEKRLRKVHKFVSDHGRQLQYSVYIAALSRMERIRFETELVNLINAREDRVMVINLGPETSDATLSALYFLGQIPPFDRAARQIY